MYLRERRADHMLMEELNAIETPSDATFWAGAAGATIVTVGVGLLFCS